MTKFYQSLHIYSGYARQYEKDFKPGDQPELTFTQLNDHLRQHGYYQSYILDPPVNTDDSTFFNIWDYRRVQNLWAKENNLPDDSSLRNIRLAQIESVQPDVIFDMSPFVDTDFIKELIAIYGKDNIRYICWNSYIKEYAMTFPEYHGHTSLHRPFVNHWNLNGIPALELQPGIPNRWLKNSVGSERDIDILFYGQYLESIFQNRKKVIQGLLKRKLHGNDKIEVYLQVANKSAEESLSDYLSLIKAPVFAETLHEKLKRTKVVVNTYGDNNQHYKSNARVFEAIGHGALLVSERGTYPAGFVDGEDYISYNGLEELNEVLDEVLNHWERYDKIRKNAQLKISRLYSSTIYFNNFKKFVEYL
ncbi:glycosyltransferase [Aliidiomarina quisquiliarum]|uniref:glycosyltransferase family protein n=1 Tax=Aliidiomarina quisquiliarum TaxID=2938947 RepID=UPI00208F835B|nr:glycosyltransferase [Aliidiomarina quisquiliarum]MCO4322073.1 glycosyltransferase [Aliidiomarina quisquiliarum]